MTLYKIACACVFLPFFVALTWLMLVPKFKGDKPWEGWSASDGEDYG